MKPKKIAAEIAVHVTSIAGGFAVHLVNERWDIAFVVTLALECFRHFTVFLYTYRNALEKLSDWAEHEKDFVDTIKIRNHELQTIRQDFQFLKRNIIPMQYIVPAPEDWPFKDRFSQVVDEFRAEIAYLLISAA
jgi:hypothetical protein